MKRIDPGQLDRKISVNRIYYKRDDAGSEVVSAKPVINNIWAKAEDLTGLEDEENGRIVSASIRQFTVRYHAEFLNDYKNLVIVDNGNEYDIIHIKEIGRKNYLQIKTINRE